MTIMSGKELILILEKNGWTLLRIKGSHHIYGQQGSNIRLSVPVHGDKPLKIGLLKYLLKAAGIFTKEDN
ncbi:type II toxin-antitoxin system HicA family toxin [bacterium]|nr:type II toxin-antitoxin system HicA family toxin [bacterium]